MADVELESGERVRFTRHDDGDGGLTIANDSGGYSAVHSQMFVANDGFDLDDVLVELLGRSEGAGWEIYGNGDADSFCAERPDPLQVPASDYLSIERESMIDPSLQGDPTDVVAVVLGSGSPQAIGCDLERRHVEPWEQDG